MLPADVALARWLRAASPPRLVLALNKCERRSRDGGSGVGDALAEATRLGLGEPVAISAETGAIAAWSRCERRCAACLACRIVHTATTNTPSCKSAVCAGNRERVSAACSDVLPGAPAQIAWQYRTQSVRTCVQQY